MSNEIKRMPAAWIDQLALQKAREVIAMPTDWSAVRRCAAIQVIFVEAMTALSAPSRKEEAPEPVAWQPIETAPHEERVLLGWVYDGAWFCETGMASHGWRRNGVSNMSRHGQATYWMPLPAHPSAPMTGSGEE